MDFFEPELEFSDELFYLKYKLTGGDLSKLEIIENQDIETCFDWLYALKVKELNELKCKIKELEKAKN